jgi:hypothetical protein
MKWLCFWWHYNLSAVSRFVDGIGHSLRAYGVTIPFTDFGVFVVRRVRAPDDQYVDGDLVKVCFKRVVKSCAGASSRDVWLSHPMEMPFVPPVGMEVCDGDWCGIVDKLAYDDGWVFAFEEEERLRENRTDEEIEVEVAEMIDAGWQRSERVLGV